MSLLRESSAITTHKSQIISQTYVYTILWHYCFAKKLTMDQQKMEKSNCITLRILTSPLSVSKGSLMNAQIQSRYVSHNSYSQIMALVTMQCQQLFNLEFAYFCILHYNCWLAPCYGHWKKNWIWNANENLHMHVIM